MKKTALLLVVAMLVSCFSLPVAASEPEPAFFTNLGFADIATYASPSGVTFTGKSYVAKVVPGGADKALLLKNGTSKLTANAPVKSGTGLYWIQTRIKLDDINSKKTISLTAGSTKIQAVTISPNYAIANSKGSKIGKLTLGKWTDIAFMIDAVSGKGDIYINGTLVQSRFTFGKTAVSAVSFESAAALSESSWSIDYIRSYESDSLIGANDYKYELNNEILADSSLELPVEAPVQSQLIVGYDFEDDAVGYVPDGFWSKNDPYVDERDDGEGRAFRVERKDVSVAGENYIDILTNATLSTGVIETDVYSPAIGTTVNLFTLRNKSTANFCTLLMLYTDGSVKTTGGVVVARGVNKKWTNIAVALDFSMRTFDVYVDRELVAEDVDIPNANTEDYIQLVRFELTKGAYKGCVWYDNMFVYTGSELASYSADMKADREAQRLAAEEEERLNGPKGDPVPVNADMTYFTNIPEQVSKNPSAFLGNYDSAREAYKDAFCVVGNNANVMIGGNKYAAPAPTIYKDMNMLVPVRTLGAAYGFDIGWDADTGAVTIGDDISIKNGDTSFDYKGKRVELSVPVQIVDGVTYLELRPFAEKVLNSYMHQSDYGIAIVSEQKLSYSAARNALQYLVYDRPNATTLYNTLTERNPNYAHPRVMFDDEDFARAMNVAVTDANGAKWSATALKSADSLIKSALPEMAYDTAGLRLQNLPSIGEVLNLYWAYLNTGDKKYVDYMIDTAMATCNNYTTWGHNTHYLEVGETCAAMGLAFDLFYDNFTQEQRDLIAGKILEYGLRPSQERYNGENPYNGLVWPTNPNNWNIVVNKGIIMAALAIGDEYEPDLCMDMLEKALKSVEYMMPTFAPEGAWGEGPSYWEYTVSNVMRAVQSLYTCLGSDYGISATPGFLDTGYYPFQISGNSGVFAYHDVSRVYVLSGSSSVFKIAELANNPSLAALQLATMNKNGSSGDITSLLYYNPDFIGESEPLDTDCLYSSSQVASIRSDWSSNAVWAGIHAGANDFAHGHIDLGSFEYEADGVKFASDMGKDNYNLPGYWSTTVRNLYITRAEGHNLYVINPDMGAGQEVRASSEITQVEVKDQGSIYTIDMTPAYASQVNSAIRGFKLSEHRRVFTVQDEITPLGNDEYYWFWHTAADIDIAEDGKSVTLTSENRKVTVYFDASVDFRIEKGLSLPLSTSPVVDGQLGNLKTTINKITVRFKSEAGVPLTFRATAVPSGCKYVPSGELTSISEWSIPDGESNLIYPVPTAILVDGAPVEGFNSAMNEYSVPVYNVPEKMPVVSIEGVENYTVKQPTMDDPTAVIEIPSITNADFTYTYYVIIDISTSLTRPSAQSLDIVNIEASAIPEAENPPANMRDKNFETRWAADGKQWAIFDLGDTMTVSGFGIGIYQGLARSQVMEILVSEDGVNYTSVLKGRTSKLTTEMEYIEFVPVKARYVKFVGSGNSANAWNSITEIEIFGQ